MDRLCPACETRQTFGVVMDPLPDGSHRCPQCQHREYPANVDDPSDMGAAMEDEDPFDERRRQLDAERAAAALDRLTGVERDETDSPLEGLAEVYEADTSRRGRDVAPNAGGGGNGRIRKPEPNWRRWIRRGT